MREGRSRRFVNGILQWFVLHLYLRYGFAISGVEHETLFVDEVYYDELLMTSSLQGAVADVRNALRSVALVSAAAVLVRRAESLHHSIERRLCRYCRYMPNCEPL